MRVGVIGIQGAVSEHIYALKKASFNLKKDIEIVEIKCEGVVYGCDAIVLTGGESTTIGRLLKEKGIAEEIKEIKGKNPILCTCAGLILASKKSEIKSEYLLNLMDITVNRNHFGRQKNSFEIELDISFLDMPFNSIFIRAPAIIECGIEVKILATIGNIIVAVEEKNVIGLAFHPELSKDYRIHEYFLSKLYQ